MPRLRSSWAIRGEIPSCRATLARSVQGEWIVQCLGIRALPSTRLAEMSDTGNERRFRTWVSIDTGCIASNRMAVKARFTDSQVEPGWNHRCSQGILWTGRERMT